MKKSYRKIAQPQGVAIYQADNGDKLVLVPVNREYEQSRKPIYYLKQSKKAKTSLFVWAFVTSDPAVFGDLKDPVTDSNEFYRNFKDGGDRLLVEGLSWQQANVFQRVIDTPS